MAAPENVAFKTKRLAQHWWPVFAAAGFQEELWDPEKGEDGPRRQYNCSGRSGNEHLRATLDRPPPFVRFGHRDDATMDQPCMGASDALMHLRRASQS
jgi:hypothetical protein